MAHLTENQVFNLVSGSVATGQSTYDMWKSIEGNEDKSVQDFLNYLKDDGESNVSEETLAQIEKNKEDISQLTEDRTHYHEKKYGFLFAFDTDEGNRPPSNHNGSCVMVENSGYKFVEGETYTIITVDKYGVEISGDVVCTKNEVNFQSQFQLNLSTKLINSQNETTDNYRFYQNESESDTNIYGEFDTWINTGGRSMIKLYGYIGEELKQLDEKYIPDTIARKSDLADIDLSAYETKEDAITKYSAMQTEIDRSSATTSLIRPLSEIANYGVTIKTNMIGAAINLDSSISTPNNMWFIFDLQANHTLSVYFNSQSMCTFSVNSLLINVKNTSSAIVVTCGRDYLKINYDENGEHVSHTHYYTPYSGSVLLTTNKNEYTPTSDYHPSTKKYVDDAVAHTNESIKDAKLELREEIKDTKSTIVQPDWDEEDETSPAYIQNKPTSLGGGVTWLSILEHQCSISPSNIKYLSSENVVKGLVESDYILSEGEQITIDEIVSLFKNGVVRCKMIGSGGLLGYGTMTGYYSNSSRFVLLVTYTTFGTGVQNKVYYFNSSSTTSTSTSTTTSTTTTSTTTTTTSTNV